MGKIRGRRKRFITQNNYLSSMVENNNSIHKTLARRIRNLQGQRDTLMEMVAQREEQIDELKARILGKEAEEELESGKV